MKMEYNIGDKVWFAKCDSIPEQITCDACAGKKYLTVIMGNGDRVDIDCATCQSGYDPPKGYNLLLRQKAESVLTTITAINIQKNEIEYTTSEGYRSVNRIFKTESEADKRAAELGAEYEADQLDKLKNKKEYDKRTWSWNAGYHRREIKELERRLEYHRAKLEAAKQHMKNVEQKNEHGS